MPVKKPKKTATKSAEPPARAVAPKPAPGSATLKWLTVRGAAHNNLKNIDVAFPLGRFVCVTGVSGSGKSSLVNDILYAAAAAELNLAEIEPGAYSRIDGLEHLDKVIDIDQSPIGRTPRSNPATYTKVFDLIRDLYAQMPDAKLRGYPVGRFSFNVGGGRCEACEGNGAERKDMEFLADVWITCPICEGRRFNRETLEIAFKGKNISEVLNMDVQEALQHFANIPKIRHMLQTLHDVGLDYIKLGQSSTTLSGGEAQRIKLARELAKRSTGRTLYILDEPTTGLHFADIARLLAVLHGFVDAGNTVVVIEHNLDVIKTADWVIDLGPEGGAGGGRIVCEGTPEQVADCAESATGQSLRAALRPVSAGREPPDSNDVQPLNRGADAPRSPETQHFVEVVGARQHNLKDVSVKLPRGKTTVFSGLSGSGKTSLAMDTIYAEGQRRYVESLSSYARQFLGRLQKPAVDHISGLSPAIAIEQKSMGSTPRSTVGTVTEIYDYLRVLYARIGQPHCTACGGKVGTRTADQIVDAVLTLPEGSRALLLSPISGREDRGYDEMLRDAKAAGFIRARIDGVVTEIGNDLKLDRKRRHEVELVADRIVVKHAQRARLADSIEAALHHSGGRLVVAPAEPGTFDERRYNQKYSCQSCGRAHEELTPHHFSFNAPLGWCPACDGLGTQSGANPAAVVPHPERSIRDGAIAGWQLERRAKSKEQRAKGGNPERTPFSNPTLTDIVEALCRHAGIAVDEPFQNLPAEQQNKILHGTGDEWIGVGDGLSVQFFGLFPAVSRATKLSWVHRSSLSHLVADVPCSTCQGGRLRADAAAVQIAGKTIVEVCRMPLDECLAMFKALKVPAREKKVVGELLTEVVGRLKFLIDVGLEYLHLHRSAPTLSGGESQRIQLAGRLGSGLTGVLYVLDEPTIGLHPRDTQRLIKALANLRDLGNTLVMVEHDREVIAASDHIVDFGPGAGRDGGRVVAAGSPEEIVDSYKAHGSQPVGLDGSLTAKYLSGQDEIPIPAERRKGNGEVIEIVGARHNNLKNIDVSFPLGVFTAVTGVSGSGKSSLIADILHPALARKLHRAMTSPAAHEEIRGIKHIDKVIEVDQTSIGSTPTSNPATYTGVFDLIRELFARLPEAKVRGYRTDRFSFNRAGGRCEACEGAGRRKIEMHFLADVWIECEACRGTRYRSDMLDIRYRGKNISDVLNMRVDDAKELFSEIPKIVRVLQTLADVGLGYLTLGQPADTLSGGESQRVRLSAELARPSTGRTLYLLDEPTTGLHVEDVRKLLAVLNRLADLGNTVIVIEHNLDLIKSADWVIDLGPEAGAGGGFLVAEGTPEEVAREPKSHTGRHLAEVLKRSPRAEARKTTAPAPKSAEADAKPQAAKARKSGRKSASSNGESRSSNLQSAIANLQSPGAPTGADLAVEALTAMLEGFTELAPPVRTPGGRIHYRGSAVPMKDWFLRIAGKLGRLALLQFRVVAEEFDAAEVTRSLSLPALAGFKRVQLKPRNDGSGELWVAVADAAEVASPDFGALLQRCLKSYRNWLAGRSDLWSGADEAAEAEEAEA